MAGLWADMGRWLDVDKPPVGWVNRWKSVKFARPITRTLVLVAQSLSGVATWWSSGVLTNR